MEFSEFGRRFTRRTPALELMEDLGAAMAADGPVMMLGGGNPAHIPAVLEAFRQRFRAVLDDEREFRRMVADYADPAGERRFRASLAALLRREYGWPLTEANIALTGGSQQGFFMLFNLLAGPHADGTLRRILLPLTPEYIGYGDLGIGGEIFEAMRPRVELEGEHGFKYRVEFDGLRPRSPVAAICLSRPSNPTGNVLSAEEVAELRGRARALNVPLILDSAYGQPFPGIVFGEAGPVWDEDIILCLSLSKLGLPGVRTGIVVAREDIVAALSAMTAVTSLASGSVGPVLVRPMLDDGSLLTLAREVIGPWYRERALRAAGWLHEALRGCEYRLHRAEGALFLWLWLPRLGIGSDELYRRLKARGVVVLSGHHFFPGLADDDWPHRRQCLRLSYAQDEQAVQRGFEILGEEVRRAGC